MMRTERRGERRRIDGKDGRVEGRKRRVDRREKDRQEGVFQEGELNGRISWLKRSNTILASKEADRWTDIKTHRRDEMAVVRKNRQVDRWMRTLMERLAREKKLFSY